MGHLYVREMAARPSFVLHEHRRPRHHFDLRLEENGVLRSWAVPRGLPTSPAEDRLAGAGPHHHLDPPTHPDARKSLARLRGWEEHDPPTRRLLLTRHRQFTARRD